MSPNNRFNILISIIALGSMGCTPSRNPEDLIHDPFFAQQSEIRAAVMSLKADIEAANIAGLQAIHLESGKFTKFGPRRFERQDVVSTNKSEAAFFSAISQTTYDVRDLKIDVFGDIGIATYYPKVSFVRDGKEIEVSGRQTLVFLNTGSGWKLVHEHGTVKGS